MIVAYSSDNIESFMKEHHFRFFHDERRFDTLLFDDISRKTYRYSDFTIVRDTQLALETMRLIVSLRNMKKTYWKEKDSHKRRKIYSKMNYIKGELNRYEVS